MGLNAGKKLIAFFSHLLQNFFICKDVADHIIGAAPAHFTVGVQFSAIKQLHGGMVLHVGDVTKSEKGERCKEGKQGSHA